MTELPPERSCPRTAPIEGPMGWCDPQRQGLLMPHEWTDARTGETFWCPGYWHE